MTTNAARRWLIVSSLLITALQMVFLLIAPVVGYPLLYPKNLELLQIVSPVFLGYLGTAAHFIFRTPTRPVHVKNNFLGLLVKGPLIIYVLAAGGSFAAFGYANRASALPGEGMAVANLATALSLCLGVLSVTTGVITSYLFAAPDQPTSSAHPVATP